MNTATAAETVERAFVPIQQFARGWMMSEATGAYGIEIGMRTAREFWIVGRAGVLGDCPAEVAAGALAFVAPVDVQAAWDNLPAGLTPYDVARRYQSRMALWGDEAFARFDPERLELLDALGRRIIDGAPAALGGLFAGWRATPRPGGLGARVALTTQILREMRGDAHLVGILSVGLTPLDAILASTNAPPRTGPVHAERMGFVGPFRDPEEVRVQRLEAEAITARIMEAHFAVLTPVELAQFGELVETTRNALDR